MTQDNLFEMFTYVLLRAQWQRITPRYKHADAQPPLTRSDPVFADFRKGKVSSSELCRYFNIPDRVLIKLLVEKGELFE